MMFRFMIDFSRVSRLLVEEPFRGVDRMQAGNEGNWATIAEKRIINDVLSKKKPTSDFQHMGGNNLKTDVLETDKDGNKTGFSIKATKNPTVPTKMHQSGAQLGPSGSFRKLAIPGSDDSDFFRGNDSQLNQGEIGNRFFEALGDSDVARAYLMAFGSRAQNNQGRHFNLKDMLAGYGSKQSEMLEMIAKRAGNPFLSPTEMKENFGDEYDTFMDHLTNNKNEIFTQLVRQNLAKYPNSNFRFGDDFPVDRLAHLKSGSRDGRVFGDSSQLDIRDVSDGAIERAMENVNWYSDDDSFYLAPEETDDWNKRTLGIYPNTSAVDRWGAMPGRNRYDLRNKPAMAKPGLLKATMGIDEGMLTDVFGDPLYSAEINGRMNGREESVSNIRDKIVSGRRVS